MALAISNLTSGRPNNVSSFNTNSVSPTNGSIVIISIGSRLDGGNGGNTPTITSGLSLTWTQLATQNDPAGNQGVRTTIYYAKVAGSPSGAIAVDFGGQQQTDSYYSIEQITGSNTGGTNGANTFVQTVSSAVNSSSHSLSLATLKSTKNIAYGAFFNAGGGGAIGSGFTTLSNQNGQMVVEYQLNVTTVNYTYTGTNNSSGIAVELATQLATGLIGDI